jgi:hypothetical protein
MSIIYLEPDAVSAGFDGFSVDVDSVFFAEPEGDFLDLFE